MNGVSRARRLFADKMGFGLYGMPRTKTFEFLFSLSLIVEAVEAIVVFDRATTWLVAATDGKDEMASSKAVIWSVMDVRASEMEETCLPRILISCWMELHKFSRGAILWVAFCMSLQESVMDLSC